MALIVEQQPAFNTFAAGQQLIYVVNEDTGIVFNNDLVKINALLIISRNDNFTDTIHNSAYSSTPNDKGVAVFDFGPVIENYVKPQYNGVLSAAPSAASSFQGLPYDDRLGYHAVHQIDHYCYGPEVVMYVSIGFTIEFLGGDPNNPNLVAENGMYAQSTTAFTFNGVQYETDNFSYASALSPDYGFDLDTVSKILNSSNAKFLTDMPTTCEALPTDYGTVAFFNGLRNSVYSFETPGAPTYGIAKMEVNMYRSDGLLLATTDVNNNQNQGGWSGVDNLIDLMNGSFELRYAQVRFLFFGFFPANLRQSNTTFNVQLSGGDLAYYTVQAKAQSGDACSALYTINLVNECQYEPVRLAWLNKYGAWDYYTFRKKNVSTLSNKRTTYQKLRGTWNEDTFNISINKGGKKNYITETTEKISLNSDYITEDDAVWLEQLFTANDVLIVKPFFTRKGGQTDMINRFTEPCTLTTSSYTKKTIGNDKLIQYSFEIEKSYPIKSQRA